MATWKKRLLAMSGGLTIAIVVVELTLRIAGVSFQDFYKADPVRGVAHRSGASGWFRREGRQYIVINRDGFRDRDRPVKKPPGTYRIAVLGDSFAEGLQVRLEDTFEAVLEHELTQCPSVRGRSVEVLNFGVSNYGTAQELLTLRDRVWDYEPDLVLLAFFSGNDVRDNARSLKQDAELPYFTLENDRLTLDESFKNSPRQTAERSTSRVAIKALVESSRILQVIRQAWGVARLKSGASPAASGNFDEFADHPDHRQIYREPTDPKWRAAWEVTDRLISTIHEEVSHRGARFAVVTLTNATQVHPDPVVIETFRQKIDVPDLDYPDRRVRELGDRAGFKVFNLAGPFRSFAKANHVYLHGFGPNQGKGHWNEQGHKLAGQLLARWLCESIP